MKKNINKIIAQPLSSVNNKTGAWRTYRPVADYQKCVGCSLCAKLCPEACIEMIKINNELKPRPDYDYCKGCGLCAKECPVKAIKMEKEY